MRIAFAAPIALAAAVLATAGLRHGAAADPLRYRSVWLEADGASGETPLELGPVAPGAAAWTGRYPFGDGVIHGCFDPATRILTGVWIQSDFSIDCAETRHGARIWGEIRFEFAPGLESFEGWWNACGEPERFGWSGRRDPALGPVAGGEPHAAPVCAGEPVG